MSEKFYQLKIMQEMFPNATFVDANGERVADTSKTIDHIADVSKKVSLTEQWKKGELEDGEYYINSNKGDIYIDICANGSFMFTNYRSIEEVLAEVPDYIEWKNYVNGYCEEHEYNLKLSAENQRLKQLLKECRDYIQFRGGNTRTTHQQEMLDKIDEVLK